MTRKSRFFPRNNQDLKRVKVRSLLQAGVGRDYIVDVIGISPATYYRIVDDVRERRSSDEKKVLEGGQNLQKMTKFGSIDA